MMGIRQCRDSDRQSVVFCSFLSCRAWLAEKEGGWPATSKWKIPTLELSSNSSSKLCPSDWGLLSLSSHPGPNSLNSYFPLKPPHFTPASSPAALPPPPLPRNLSKTPTQCPWSWAQLTLSPSFLAARGHILGGGTRGGTYPSSCPIPADCQS